MSDPQRLRIQLVDAPSEVGREVVRGQLFICVEFDHDGEFQPLTAVEASAAGWTADSAIQHAIDNLRLCSAPSDMRPVDTLPGLHFLKCTDGRAASRLPLLHELLEPLPLGGMVVAVPDEGQLLCVPLDSARAIDALQALASAVGHLEATRDHLLSDQLFWFDGDGWRSIPVHHGEEDITVLPPPDFLRMMGHVASMDLVRVTAEA